MRSVNRSAVTMLLCGLGLAPGLAMGAEPSASDCFVPAFKAGDAEAVAACYVEDGIIWFPGGPMAKGRQAIRDGFAHYLGSVTVKDFALTPIGDETHGDSRVGWGTYTMTTVDKATQAESVAHGRYVDVQRKVDGKWLYVVDHPSDDPPPPAK